MFFSDKPIIDTELASSSSVLAELGERVELKCASKGNPTPSFEWKKDERDGLGFKSTFIIMSIKKNDFGKYNCVVSNTIGTTYHKIEVFEIGKSIKPRSFTK